MKRFFTTKIVVAIVCLYFFVPGMAQTIQSPKVRIINDLSLNPSKPVYSGIGKAASCGVDTVNYTYSKTSSFQVISLNSTNSGNAFSQWYGAPQAITVSGFDFYGWQSSNNPSAVVSVTCRLYLATTDSLPLGSPLRSVTVNVDSSFGGGLLSVLRKSAVFPTPVTVTTPYILTVETSSATNVSIVSNDYSAGNGRAEWLSSVRIGSNYSRSYAVNVNSIAFNADFILQPYVSYSLNADFTFSGCNNVGNAIQFTNTSSPVVNNRFYNRYAFYNIPQFCYTWDYGDTSGIYYSIDGNHSYYNRLSYDITLKDTIYGWTKGCVESVTKTLYATPLPPAATNDGPHCSGDTLRLFSDTVSGGAYLWSGPNGFTSSLQHPVIPVSDISHIGIYKVRASRGACVSGDSLTEVLIYKTPEVPLATNDGPKCVGDSVLFSAFSPAPGIAYQWSGPNGFTSAAPQFSFTQLDTTYAGTYIVFAEDAFCRSATDTSELYIYPPPLPPVLSTLTGDTLCAGDTLYLLGNSVTGAVFEWSGPNGFSSAVTHPFVPLVSQASAGVYQAKVIIGSCTSQPDSIAIHVNALPVTGSITGSDTSTENFQKAYDVTGTVNSTFYWTIQGGTQVSGDSSNAILVQWGVPGSGLLSVTEKNESGCRGATQQLTVDITKAPVIDTSGTSVQEMSWDELRVYPNPASGALFITTGQHQMPLAMEVLDLSGKTLLLSGLLVATPGQPRVLDISSLAKGMYLLRLQTTDREKTLRFVVK